MAASRFLRRLFGRPAKLEGPKGVAEVGHRSYIGGRWDEVGKLQFDFMVARGLEPQHALVDIACGSLRGGVLFIPYLDPGNYLGIEKEAELVDRGVKLELKPELVAEKRPEFVISDSFEFARFSRPADYAIAQSLFTHLTVDLIDLCLANLRAYASCRLFATFQEVDAPVDNPPTSNTHQSFRYSRRQLSEAGERTGWAPNYIGEWGHPRGQHMIEFRPA